MVKQPFKSQTEVTLWRNDTNEVLKFRLYGERKPGCEHIALKPGEEIEILSVYDSSVRTLDEQGRIIGGFGMKLTKDGEEKSPDFHPSFAVKDKKKK